MDEKGLIDGDGHAIELEITRLPDISNMKELPLKFCNFVKLDAVIKLLENYTHNDNVPQCGDCEERRLEERPMP